MCSPDQWNSVSSSPPSQLNWNHQNLIHIASSEQVSSSLTRHQEKKRRWSSLEEYLDEELQLRWVKGDEQARQNCGVETDLPSHRFQKNSESSFPWRQRIISDPISSLSRWSIKHVLPIIFRAYLSIYLSGAQGPQRHTNIRLHVAPDKKRSGGLKLKWIRPSAEQEMARKKVTALLKHIWIGVSRPFSNKCRFTSVRGGGSQALAMYRRTELVSSRDSDKKRERERQRFMSKHSMGI
jgi:hypothetical protein